MTSKNKNWEYSPSLESTGHVNLKKKYDLFINGKWVKSASKKYFKTINPNDETVIAEISHANQKDVDFAVASARKAYNNVWSKMPANERGKYIYRIARIMQERAKELAANVTLIEENTIYNPFYGLIQWSIIKNNIR